MHHAKRVVYEAEPYLVTLTPEGRVDRGFGPFAPGTEPSLGQCRGNNEVRDASLLDELEALVQISPELPFGPAADDETLATRR